MGTTDLLPFECRSRSMPGDVTVSGQREYPVTAAQLDEIVRQVRSETRDECIQAAAKAFDLGTTPAAVNVYADRVAHNLRSIPINYARPLITTKHVIGFLKALANVWERSPAHAPATVPAALKTAGYLVSIGDLDGYIKEQGEG